MCFSIDNPESFDNITEKWTPEMNQFCPGVPVIVVGTKKDLRHNSDVIKMLGKKQRAPVTSHEGKDVCMKMNGYMYLECSAKSNEGVKEVFETATTAALYGPKKGQGCPCVIL